MEHEEYTAENYPSFGKKYANEKAIISLTSWTARINTVSKTLYSLLTQCPGFHIVLVLSEEEFPKMMDELPENLKLFVDNELIEVLWVYKNYKSFKKVLFTMDKYRTVPVISADDDCIYTKNYAQELYDKWEKNKPHPISYGTYNEGRIRKQTCGMLGCATIWPANFFKKLDLDILGFDKLLNRNQDDPLYQNFIRIFNVPKIILMNKTCPLIFANEYKPLHDTYMRKNYGIITDKIYKEILNIEKKRLFA